jgi:hypothetical protein
MHVGIRGHVAACDSKHCGAVGGGHGYICELPTAPYFLGAACGGAVLGAEHGHGVRGGAEVGRQGFL